MSAGRSAGIGPFATSLATAGCAINSLSLAVPASVLPGRRTVLLNLMHKDIRVVRQVCVEPLPWPSRVLDDVEQIRRPVSGTRRKSTRAHSCRFTSAGTAILIPHDAEDMTRVALCRGSLSSLT